MATYYISNTGNDSNNGTSTGTPWLTINKVNTSSFVAGDSILFKCGDSWNEVLTPPSSGASGNLITFGSYGTGALPIITGFTTITGWTNEGSGVYSKVDSNWQSEMRMVTINGITRPKGRFPKTGWLPTTATSGNTSVTSTSLTGTPNYNGGEVVILKITWIIDRGIITSHSGSTISYSGTSSYSPSTGFGFFIQNHANCLTEFGDWWFDGSAKKIYMYFGAENPTNYTVKASGVVNLINVNAKNYLKFELLATEGSHSSNFHFQNCNNNSVNFCEVHKAGLYGVYLNDTGGNVDSIDIHDCTFRDTYNFAIRGENSRFINVRRNNIQRNFQFAGTTGNGDNNGSAIALGTFLYRNGGYNIENNYLSDVGYNGIYVSGKDVLIQKNIILRACQTKEDGAAIYLFGAKEQLTDTYNTNRIVRRNIVREVVPNSNPTPYSQREAYGIYFDDRSRNIICDYNLVDRGYGGVYFHNARDITFQYNKVHDNTWFQLYLGDDSIASDADGNIQGLDVRFNHFYAKGSAGILKVNNEVSSIADFGTISTNYYIKPDGGVMIRKFTNHGSEQTYSTIAAWTSAHGYDSGTLGSPTSSQISEAYYNATDAAANVVIGSSRKGVDGTALTSPQFLGSYDSIIVLEGEAGGGLGLLTFRRKYTIG